MSAANYTIRQTTDGIDITGVVSGKYMEQPIEVDEIPRFTFDIPDDSGVKSYQLDIGKEVQIKRNGVSVFVGVVEEITPKKSGSGVSMLRVRGASKAHKLLQARICDSYDFDEDGNPSTTRDAVTVNPWRFFVARKTGGTLDDNGLEPPVDGVTADEIVQNIIGTKFTHQHDFQDNSFLLGSQVYSRSNRLQAYVDGESGDARPYLQRSRRGEYIKAGGAIESIPLENGDPNIDTMGNIASATVTIIGQRDGTDDPTIRLCRNARDSRTYNSVSLTHTANYLSSGLDAWTGSLTFADAPANKNSLGYELTLPSGGVTDSKFVFSLAGGTSFDVFHSDDSGDSWDGVSVDTLGGNANESSSIQCVGDNVYALYSDFNGATFDLKFAKSTDGGDTFGASATIESTFNAIDPSLHAIDASNLVMSYVDNTNNIVYSRVSSDGGATWGSRQTVDSGRTTPRNSSTWANDTSNFGVIYEDANNGDVYFSFTTNGGTSYTSTLVEAGNDAFSPSRNVIGTSGTTYIMVYRGATNTGIVAKTTNGTTFAKTTLIASPDAAPRGSIAKVSATNYVVAMEDSTNSNILFFDSTDSGATWSSSTTVDNFAAAPSNIEMIVESSTIYHIMMARSGVFGETNARVIISSSYDSGATWLTGVSQTASSTLARVSFALCSTGNWTTATSSTKVQYIRIDAVTASDTGLSEGTIEAYSNPTLDGIDANEADWIETDVQGMVRIEALETIRTLTESDEAANTSPHWDITLNNDLTVDFEERRGSVLAKEYSFAGGDIISLEHEFYGGELAYQTIAYGAGSGIAQTRIVSSAEFSAGGLYDSDRDPGGVTKLYGNLPRVMQFIDANENSAVALLRKARAFHKLHREPKENIRIEFTPMAIPFFATGDSITIKDVQTRTNGALRVTSLERSWSGRDMEKLRIELGENVEDVASRLSNVTSQTEVNTIRPQPAQSLSGANGAPIKFDKDSYGMHKFAVSGGKNIARVLLDITAVPWANDIRAVSASTFTRGISFFDGDGGTGTGDPVYSNGIRFAIDPTINASTGVPSDFAADRHTMTFGNASTPQRILIDATGFMRTEANGLIADGEHIVAFQSTSSTANNSLGLAAVTVTPYFIYRDAST